MIYVYHENKYPVNNNKNNISANVPFQMTVSYKSDHLKFEILKIETVLTAV